MNPNKRLFANKTITYQGLIRTFSISIAATAIILSTIWTNSHPSALETLVVGFINFTFVGFWGSAILKNDSTQSTFMHYLVLSYLISLCIIFTGGNSSPVYYLLLLFIMFISRLHVEHTKKLTAFTSLFLLLATLISDPGMTPPIIAPRYALKQLTILLLQISILYLTALLPAATKTQEEPTSTEPSEKKQLLDKNQSLGMLVGGISHELKTPLTSIMGFAELSLQKIIKKTADINEIKEYLKIIIQSSDHCLIIIQDLLDFAKPSRVDKKVFRSININNCIDATIKIIYHHMKIKNITILKEYDPDLPLIKGNYNQIRQVLLNLLINARDAIQKDGIIKIKTYRDQKSLFTIIEDSGTGIDPETLRHIFEPFFTTKEKGKGTGLGLPVSLELIKEHKGNILIESELGKGTKTSIILPIEDVSVN